MQFCVKLLSVFVLCLALLSHLLDGQSGGTGECGCTSTVPRAYLYSAPGQCSITGTRVCMCAPPNSCACYANKGDPHSEYYFKLNLTNSKYNFQLFKFRSRFELMLKFTTG